MIHELVHAITEPDKQTIKRAQMIRTVVQMGQFFATTVILVINVILLVRGR